MLRVSPASEIGVISGELLRSYGILGIELGLSMCKAKALHTVLSS